MDPTIIDSFASVARLSRSEIFDDSRLDPTSAIAHSSIPAPGWVGERWSCGTLLVAINPGGGGDAYRVNPTDAQLYRHFEAFRNATGASEQASKMRVMSDYWMKVQTSHNIWRIVSAIIDATSETVDQLAYINIVPFRTREDKMPRKPELQRAWQVASKRQIEALKPKRILALGKKAYTAMESAGADKSYAITLLKRTIGDSYICAEAQAVLKDLRENRN